MRKVKSLRVGSSASSKTDACFLFTLACSTIIYGSVVRSSKIGSISRRAWVQSQHHHHHVPLVWFHNFIEFGILLHKYLVATYWLVISKESYNCWPNHQQSEKMQLILKKTEHRRIDAFELWCWRRLSRVPWTERRSNQSILKEITPEYTLEGLMLKLKLQYFGHLMQRADLLEKTLIMGKTEGRKRRGWQRMRWLDGITNLMDMSLSKF